MGYSASPQYMVPGPTPVWDKHAINPFSGYAQRCPSEPNRPLQTIYGNEGLFSPQLVA